jgi:hypothetical protein
VWAGVRVRRGEPVAYGVRPALSATVSGAVAVLALALGMWCFTRM